MKTYFSGRTREVVDEDSMEERLPTVGESIGRHFVATKHVEYLHEFECPIGCSWQEWQRRQEPEIDPDFCPRCYLDSVHNGDTFMPVNVEAMARFNARESERIAENRAALGASFRKRGEEVRRQKEESVRSFDDIDDMRDWLRSGGKLG